MKVFRFNFMVAVVILALLLPASISASPEIATNTPVNVDILVKFSRTTSLSEMALVNIQNDGQVKKILPAIGVQVITVPTGKLTEKVKAYRTNPNVVFAEPDNIATADISPDDPYLNRQWGLAKVMATNAWGITTGSADIRIAILDTGVDPNHPDLQNKIVANKNFTTSTTTSDICGHGTHVAGIAAATTNNSVGTAGLGYSSSIMNVKVLGDSGSGSYSWIANGIIWATDNGADVINMSMGGSAFSSTLESAINYAWSKGVIVVASAGNSGNSTPCYPAYFNNVIAVAATDSTDKLTSWSNYGSWVDVAAPGSSIYSTLINSSYGYKSGTSMASPFVAGLAALVFTRVSDTNGNVLLNDEVRAQIESSCDSVGSSISGGRINAYKAVQTDSPPPIVTGSITGKVTDSTNNLPIAGASVTNGTTSTTTDTNGCYSFNSLPVGIYNVAASATGYTSKSQSVSVISGQTVSVNFALTKEVQTIPPPVTTGAITGKITNSANSLPIAGASVTNGTTSTTTDTNGCYSFNSLPVGIYNVAASATGYTSKSQSVSVISGQTVSVNFALTKEVQTIPPPVTTGAITGKITNSANSLPIAGASVTNGTTSTTTDTNGCYSFNSLPVGIYNVAASATGYISKSQSVSVISGQTVSVNFALTKEVQTIPPPVTTGAITGKITNSANSLPIAGASVTNGTTSTTTDTNGCYSFNSLPVGTYNVAASATGYTSKSQSVSVISGQTVSVNFALTKEVQTIPPPVTTGAITGKITNSANSLPIAGASVTNGTTSTTTDTNGCYSFNSLPAGTYNVAASATGYISKSQSVSVISGQTVSVNFILTATTVPTQPVNNLWVKDMVMGIVAHNLQLKVSIIGESGVIAGAQVTIRITRNDGKVWTYRGTTDINGDVIFTVQKPISGTYTAVILSITATNYTWDSSTGINSTSYVVNSITSMPNNK